MEKCVEKYYIKNNSVINSDDFKEDAEKIQSGKCVYEVIRMINCTPLFVEKHIMRMKNSASLINKTIPISDSEIIKEMIGLCRSNDIQNGNIKIVIIYDNKGNSDVLMYFISHYYPSKSEYENGVDTILYYGERDNPNAKIINSDFRNKVDAEIKQKHVFEAALVDNNGFITEGSKSNLFFVKDNCVYTSPVKKVLPGVTRKYVFDICKKLNIKIIETEIEAASVNTFDAIFISGTSPKILPVRKVENFNFTSSFNDIVLKIIEGYNNITNEYIKDFNK